MKSMFLLLFVVLGTTDAAFTSFSRLNIPTNITSGGKVWALLVAGSNTYENYRHQVCVCVCRSCACKFIVYVVQKKI